MSVVVTVTNKQGNTMGTVIAKVTDPDVQVRDVYFYIAVPGRSPELGPFPPDIVRRPSPGVYEKDVVLDPEYTTIVRTVVLKHDGTEATGIAVQTLDPRTATAGGIGEVRVKDANTAPTAADTIAIKGAAVNVIDRAATFNLDGVYAQLSSAAFTGDVSVGGGRAVLGVDSFNGNAKLELGRSTAGGTVPYIDFHHGVGAEQDYNARLMNNANNLLTLTFAGAGTLNVAGTIAQHGVAVSLSDHHHDARYAPAIHTHEYLPLAGGTVVGSTSFTGGLNAGGIRSTSNIYSASDGAYMNLSNTAALFLTSGSGALQGRFGSLLLSNDYQHAQYVPPNGLWVTGGTSLGALTTRGLATVQGGLRFVNGGYLQANRADGAAEPVFWPRGTDNNTYLNYGGGGYFYIRDNASNQRLIFAPEGTGFTTWIQARGVNYDLRLGGARSGAHSQVTSTPNLHLDCADTSQTYINYYNGRPTNIGGIDQSTYKLAVNGDAILHNNGWFRNAAGGTGLYNEGVGRHLYAGWDGHNSGWNIAGGAGETFLALRDIPGSAPRGWLFANAEGFGLLHSWRGWAVRTWRGGVELYDNVLVPGQLVGQGNWGVVIGGSMVANRRVRVGEIHDDSGMFALDARNLRLTATAGKEVRLSIDDAVRLRVHGSGVQMHGAVAVSDGNVAAYDFVLT